MGARSKRRPAGDGRTALQPVWRDDLLRELVRRGVLDVSTVVLFFDALSAGESSAAIALDTAERATCAVVDLDDEDAVGEWWTELVKGLGGTVEQPVPGTTLTSSQVRRAMGLGAREFRRWMEDSYLEDPDWAVARDVFAAWAKRGLLLPVGTSILRWGDGAYLVQEAWK